MKMRNILFFMGIAGVLFSIVGCNTSEGFGEDVQATGDAIENAAENAND